MATHARTIRRGLPRWPGGESWPPAGDASVAVAETVDGPGAPEEPSVMPDAVAAAPVTSESETGANAANTTLAEPVTMTTAGGTRPIRGRSPRIAGGEPGRPSGEVTEPAAVAASDPLLRRGLPRVKDGEPWPPAGFAPAASAPPVQPAVPEPVGPAAPKPVEKHAASASTATAVPPASQPTSSPVARPTMPPRPTTPVSPRPATATAPAKAPGRFDAYSPGELVITALVGGFGLLLAATTAVVAASWFLSSPFGRDFLAAFPGEYALPEGTTSGFPAWVQWQHFFNVFLMVLIIRSGLQVRTEKRPSAYWTPRWSKNGSGKISLSLWFHQSLDILWLVNGAIFVVLLFVTGHWMRIVPTSLEIFPNAISALLQYMSLDWPTENGWVNYNSLQQLMYFTTVFLAAPAAAITGVRMSGLWPKSLKTLNRAYPVEWARAIHFPVMLYFMAFIIVHVALVFATGALRNLNNMYGGTDVVNWAGFWIFFASLVIIVVGWIAFRPVVLAQIARLSGKVTAR